MKNIYNYIFIYIYSSSIWKTSCVAQQIKFDNAQRLSRAGRQSSLFGWYPRVTSPGAKPKSVWFLTGSVWNTQINSCGSEGGHLHHSPWLHVLFCFWGDGVGGFWVRFCFFGLKWPAMNCSPRRSPKTPIAVTSAVVKHPLASQNKPSQPSIFYKGGLLQAHVSFGLPLPPSLQQSKWVQISLSPFPGHPSGAEPLLQ